MAKSIESRIRFEAAIIYVIVALGIVAMIVYLSGLRGKIASRRAEITSQQELLSATNRLIFAMGDAQSSSSLYLSTRKQSYLTEYTQTIDRIESLIDTIAAMNPRDREQLEQIGALLRGQVRKVTQLNRQFAQTNPVAVIRERLQGYEPASKLDTLIVNVRQDTLVGQSPRRGFFRRLGDVFRQRRDSVKVIVKERVDTIRVSDRDSLGILTEVGDIAQKAQEVYDQNIKSIERQVGELIVSDQDIARKASTLLQKLHSQTLDATLAVIDSSERAIGRNYLYSVVGGVVALVLILLFIAMIITDINKGRAARQALEAANLRTRQIMESRHRLLLAVSHDIKSPLNSILGYLGMMSPDERVGSMRNSSEHILAMLENLLEFSSLEQGTLQKSLSDFNLRELYNEIYEMFRPLAAQKSLSLQVEADDVRIHGDRVKIKQIVINVVSNAIKYTLHGEVSFTAHLRDAELQLVVRDTGAGIPAAKLSELFRPFSRIEENNSLAGGSGLGMFVVKGLVELLGGNIGVESTVGQGTTISVMLPIGKALREIPRGTKTVRVYDDDPVVVKVVTDMLLRLGHRVAEADFDLILTDMEMGDITGVDILRSAGDTPVVVMTGRADFSSEKARELGFDGFLAKPFTQDALREIVGDGDPADDLLGDDRDEILALFRASTAENYEKLRRAVADGDFKAAQAVCHKMYPMFAQLGYPTEELRRMDTHRDGVYDGWQDDVRMILDIRV